MLVSDFLLRMVSSVSAARHLPPAPPPLQSLPNLHFQLHHRLESGSHRVNDQKVSLKATVATTLAADFNNLALLPLPLLPPPSVLPSFGRFLLTDVDPIYSLSLLFHGGTVLTLYQCCLKMLYLPIPSLPYAGRFRNLKS